ncbi:MAG: ABC transporter substrate-binding protein [Candidatus Bipolaricaulia bacterium]
MKKARYFGLGLMVMLLTIGFLGLVEAQAQDTVAVINGQPVILSDPAVAFDWYDTQAVYNLYSPLVYPTVEGGLRPHLAESWETVGGRLNHWRFKLRSGVKFHDDSELTAEDVVFSMNRFLTIGQGYSSILGTVVPIAIDRYTVDFLLGQPNAEFPTTLTLFWTVNKDLVLEHLGPGEYGRFGDYGQEWLSTHDAGSGPYMLVSHSPGDRLEAERFEDYFLGWKSGANEVPIDRLLFIMESNPATLLTLLKTGQLDIEANGGWSRTTLADIDRTPGLRRFPVWTQNITVWINTAVPPTDDVHFRRAILNAYDYGAVFDQYSPFGARFGGVYSASLPGFLEGILPQQQNLVKARQELALSKYDPSDVKVVFHYCCDLKSEEEIGLQLQADLAQLGVEVEIVNLPWPQYSAESTAPETTPNMSIFLFPIVYPSPDSFMFFMFHPDNVGGIYASHWFADQGIGQLIDRARATLDSDDRIGIYQELQRKIADQAVALYAYEIPTQFTVQDYLVGPEKPFPIVGPTIDMHNWRIDTTRRR